MRIVPQGVICPPHCVRKLRLRPGSSQRIIICTHHLLVPTICVPSHSILSGFITSSQLIFPPVHYLLLFRILWGLFTVNGLAAITLSPVDKIFELGGISRHKSLSHQGGPIILERKIK